MAFQLHNKYFESWVLPCEWDDKSVTMIKICDGKVADRWLCKSVEKFCLTCFWVFDKDELWLDELYRKWHIRTSLKSQG